MTTPVARVERVVHIHPQHRVFDWRELWEYRDLFRFLVARDVKVRHVQSVFGFAWVVLRPLFTVLVFTLVFGMLARLPSDGLPYAVFSFTGLIPWAYFSQAITKSADSLVLARGVISKVYYPRVLVPLTPVIALLVDFVVGMAFVLLVAAAYGYWPTASLLVVPLLVALMVVTAVGIGLWTSALAVQYRDIRSAVPLLAQLLMYVAPVIWPLSMLEQRLQDAAPLGRMIYGLYPMAGVIEGFRAAVLGVRPIPWDMLATGTLSAVLILASGLWFFARREPRFADVA